MAGSCPLHTRLGAPFLRRLQSRSLAPRPCLLWWYLHSCLKHLHSDASLSRGLGLGPPQTPLLRPPYWRQEGEGSQRHFSPLSVLSTFPLLASPSPPAGPRVNTGALFFGVPSTVRQSPYLCWRIWTSLGASHGGKTWITEGAGAFSFCFYYHSKWLKAPVLLLFWLVVSMDNSTPDSASLSMSAQLLTHNIYL